MPKRRTDSAAAGGGATRKTLWVIGASAPRTSTERLAGLGAGRTHSGLRAGRRRLVAADDDHAPHLLVRAEPHANEIEWAAETAAAARTTAMLTEPDESPDATGDAVARPA